MKGRAHPVRTRPPIPIREGGWSLGGTSIVQRGKKFAVACYAGLDPTTHKQRYKWFSGFATRKEAEQFRLTLAHHPSFACGVGPYGSPRLRLVDYLKHWLHERKVNGELRGQTPETTERLIRLYINPYLGHVPLARLSPPAIQFMYTSLLQRETMNRGPNCQDKKYLSPATVVRAAGVLHAALERAVHRGLIVRNPMENTTLPSVPEYEPEVPSPDQIVAYLNDAIETATPALVAVYAIMTAHGCRPGELLGLPETAVDLDAGLLRIRRDLDRAGRAPVFGRPKTKRAFRTIRLPECTVQVIRDALLWKKEQHLRLGPTYRDCGLLFVGQFGRPLNLNNVRHRDHLPRLKRLGLPRSRPYDLRHFYGTHNVGMGIDYRTVGDVMGHKRASFTLDRYVHASTAGQERTAACANDLLMKTARFAR